MQQSSAIIEQRKAVILTKDSSDGNPTETVEKAMSRIYELHHVNFNHIM
jgi:hypothetical protein